jgi:hypothetical protein
MTNCGSSRCKTLWMRVLFPSRAFYQCASCGDEFLVSVADQANMGRRAQEQRLQSHLEKNRDAKSPRNSAG